MIPNPLWLAIGVAFLACKFIDLIEWIEYKIHYALFKRKVKKDIEKNVKNMTPEKFNDEWKNMLTNKHLEFELLPKKKKPLYAVMNDNKNNFNGEM